MKPARSSQPYIVRAARLGTMNITHCAASEQESAWFQIES